MVRPVHQPVPREGEPERAVGSFLVEDPQQVAKVADLLPLVAYDVPLTFGPARASASSTGSGRQCSAANDSTSSPTVTSWSYVPDCSIAPTSPEATARTGRRGRHFVHQRG
jgi:hypothetical protein